MKSYDAVLMKIISWNVNGINSIIEKGFWMKYFSKTGYIMPSGSKSTEIPEIDCYIPYNNPSSELTHLYGTAVYSKVEPLSVKKGFGDKEFDSEGRVIRKLLSV